MRSDLLRGHLDGLLLAALAASPGHGYTLSERLAERNDWRTFSAAVSRLFGATA